MSANEGKNYSKLEPTYATKMAAGSVSMLRPLKHLVPVTVKLVSPHALAVTTVVIDIQKKELINDPIWQREPWPNRMALAWHARGAGYESPRN